MNAANPSQSSQPSATWSQVTSRPEFQEADPKTRGKIREAFFDQVVRPITPEGMLDQTRDGFLSATEQDITPGGGGSAPDIQEDEPSGDTWNALRDSEEFQQADWQTRQRMRGDFYDRHVRSRVPAGKRDEALGRFMTATEEDVFGKRRDPLADSESLNAGYGGGLAERRALEEREGNSLEARRRGPVTASGDDSEGDQGSVLTDFGNLLAIGTDRAALNAREAVRQTFGEGVMNAIDKVDEWMNGEESEALLSGRIERNEGQLTPETREAREKAWIDEGEDGYSLGPAWGDWRSYAAGITESIPETAMTMAPSAVMAKGVYAWNLARGVAPKLAAKRAATTATLAGGLSEGALGGGASARDVRETIQSLDDETLRNSEAVQALMTEGKTLDEAREILAEDASSQAFVTSGVVTGAFGGLGDRTLAKILTGGPSTRLGSAVRAAVGEGVFEEMPQEAGQQLSENMAVRRADPSVTPFEGVPNAAAGGLVLGAGMGAGIGGMAGGSRNTDQTVQEGEAAIPSEPGGANPQGAESAFDAASLIGNPRSELDSAQREARDSLLYGDGFKALRRLAEERGDTQAVADLDALSEEASDLLEMETLTRTRGDGEAMGQVRERLAGVAQRFTGVTDRLRDRPREDNDAPRPVQDNQTDRTEAEWEQAWRDQGMENPSENLPDTTINITPGRPEMSGRESPAQLSEVAITQAREVAAAQGGDALDQALAGEVAEQVTSEQTTQREAQPAQGADDLVMRLDAAATDLDQLSQAARDAGIETSSRQRRLSTVLDRAESALEAGNTEQAERLYQRANTIAANLRQEIEGALVATQRVEQPAGEQVAQDNLQGATPQLRSNGLPFSTRQEAEVSGRFRAHQRAGRRVQAVEVPEGWGVITDDQAQQQAGDERQGRRMAQPIDTQRAQTGQPIRATGYRINDIDPGELYAGAQTPVMGQGLYVAPTQKDARAFTRNQDAEVSTQEVALDNPLVIRSDNEWRELTREAGWETPNPSGRSRDQVEEQTRALQQVVRARGHDGIAVLWNDDTLYDMDEVTGNRIKTLRNVFSKPQVVSFDDAQQQAEAAAGEAISGQARGQQPRMRDSETSSTMGDEFKTRLTDGRPTTQAGAQRQPDGQPTDRRGQKPGRGEQGDTRDPAGREGQAEPRGVAQDQGLIFKADGSPFTSEKSALASGKARRARSQNQPVSAVPVEGGFAVRTGQPVDAVDTTSERVDETPNDRQDADDLASATAFGTRSLTPGETAFITRAMGKDDVRRGPRTEIQARAQQAGLLDADNRLNVRNLSAGDRRTLSRAVRNLPEEQAQYADLAGEIQQALRDSDAQERRGQMRAVDDADPLTLETQTEDSLAQRERSQQQADQADVTAAEIESAAQQTDTNPTPAQAEAGNYRKGKVRINGFEIAIENPRGSMRRGTAPDGTPWESEMAHHYGDIKGTTAADGDNLDVFVGENTDSPTAFVIDQVNADGSFDEHKVMLGFDALDEARQGYLANYDEGWQGLGDITEVPVEQLKTWVSEGDTTQPYASKRKESGERDTDDSATNERQGSQSESSAADTRSGEDAIPRRSMAGMPDALIHAPLSAERDSPDYRAAKLGDPDAATRYVESLMTVAELRRLREAIGDRQPVVVPVRAQEAEGRNKIPSAYARLLAETLGLEVDGGIVQMNRAQRSQMDGLERLFVQPEFDGQVEAGRDYLIVDDTLTQGGTVAALKGHIEANGGQAIQAAALTGKQYSATLSPDPALLAAVRDRFGDIEADFIEIQGYGYDQLTQSEARYLSNLTSKADAFRDRVAAGRDAARRAADGRARREEPEGSAAQGRTQAVTPPASNASGRDQDPQFAFAGERAETADTRPLGNARERIERGDDPETVRRETGWFQGDDERWRYEINDSDARFLPFANGTAGELWTESLDHVLDHPALFAAYPGLRELDVVSARGMENQRGRFIASRGEIVLNADRSPMEQFSTLLHEIQHGIQYLEGYATGGNPSDYRLPPLREKWLNDRVQALGRQSGENANALMSRYREGELSLEEVRDGVRQYAERIGLNELRQKLREGNERGAYRYYQRLAGEVEARNVQARQGMDVEERRTTPPRDTADVPQSEVVVVFNGTALEQAPPPANASPALPPNGAPYVSDVAQRLDEHPSLAGVRAVQSVTELPGRVVTTMEARGIDAGQVAGVYDPTTGESFVVADNLMDTEEGVRRAVHEAVGHQGIRGVLGSDLDRVMMEVYRSYMGSEAGRTTIRQVREAYPFLDVTTREGRLGLAEELVARVVEEADGRPALRERVMAAIRHALRTMFPGVAWTDGAVRVLGDRARRYMEARQALQAAGPGDPADTLGLRSVVRGEGNEAGLSLDEAQGVVDEFVNGFRGNLPLEVRVASTQEALYGPQATVDRVGRIKGAYHPARSVMTIVAGNASGKRDIQRTLRHEILGHYGLNTFSQREKRALLDRILETQEAPSMSGVWGEVRRNYADASPDLQAEEVFAHVAEVDRGALGEAWDRVLSFLQRILRRVGLIKSPVSRRELHDLVRRVGEGVREGRRPQQTSPETDQDQFSREAPRDDEGIRFSLKSEQPESAGGPYSPNDTTGFALPDESLGDVALRRMADKMRPLLRLRRAIQQAGGVIEEEADPYLSEELYHGRLERDLEGLRNEYVEPLAEGLAKAGISQAGLDDYLYALHAPERNAVVAERNPNDESLQDGGSGMTNAEAEAIIDKVKKSGKQGAYDRMAKIVHDITAMRRDAIRDGGLETDDVLDAWDATYEHYVPLKGFAADEAEAPRIGKGFQITGKESFMVKGRRTRAASPSTQAIVDANLSLIRRRKNEVGNAFLSLVTDQPNPALWEVFTDDNPDAETSTVRVTDPETGEKRWEVRERPVQMGRDDRYFKTKRAGRTYYVKVKDQRLLNAMRNVGPETNGWLIRTAGAATRIMSSLVTSYNPEFLVTNFERDIQTGLLNIGAEQTRDDGKIKGQRILWDTARDVRPAMRAAWRGLNRSKASNDPRLQEWDRWFEEFVEDGAKTGYFDMKDIDAQAKEIAAMVRRADGTTLGHMRRFTRKTADLVENVNGAVENAVRLSAYTNARRNGLSRRKAASLAKNLTVNFNRRGEVGTALNAAYMFANASIQGVMNFSRVMVTLKDTPKGRSPMNVWARMNLGQKIGMGMASGAFALAMLNRWLSDEDDDGVLFYDKIPDHVKERHYVLMTGWATGNPEDYIKVPLPYGYNVFAVAGTHAESVMAGTESAAEAGKNLGLAVVGSFSPIGWEDSESLSGIAAKNLSPTLVRSLTQLGWNEDFAARPIYKENFPFGAPKPESSLSFRSTPEAYKTISKVLNDITGGTENIPGGVDLNPDVLQHLVNYYGGGAWGFMEKTADLATRSVTGQEIENYRVPFAGRVLGSVTPYPDQQQFYQRRDELWQIREEADSLKGREGMRYRLDHRDELRLFDQAKATASRLTELRKVKDRLEASEMLSDEARRARVERIEEAMEKRVDRFNRLYNEALLPELMAE